MSIKQYKKAIHWDYFLTLEQDIKNLARYIEFDKDNNKVYSIELVRILQISSSEIDVILKLLCRKLNPNKMFNNINDYRNEIMKSLSIIANEKVYASRYGMEFKPWVSWKKKNNPNWWKAYNNVKHQRDIHYKDANLKNTLNSVAALFVITCYYYLIDIKGIADVTQFPYVFLELKNNSEIFEMNTNYHTKYIVA